MASLVLCRSISVVNQPAKVLKARVAGPPGIRGLTMSSSFFTLPLDLYVHEQYTMMLTDEKRRNLLGDLRSCTGAQGPLPWSALQFKHQRTLFLLNSGITGPCLSIDSCKNLARVFRLTIIEPQSSQVTKRSLC